MAHKRGHFARLVAVLLALALLASACGDSDKKAAEEAGLTQVVFQLNWVPGGFHAGFAVARDKGFYEEEGLFVFLVPGSGSATTAQMVAAGNAYLGNADAVSVSQLVAQDAPLKVIATLFQGTPSQVTALKGTGIEVFADLAGKTIAYPTGGQQAPQFPLLLEANNIDPDSVTLVGVPREALVVQLLEGNVDAILGSSDFFSIQLADRGAETVDFPFYEYGAPTVATSIFGNENWMKENPEITKAFVKASLRGWAYALDNPDEAVAAIKTIFRDANEEVALKELAATIPLYCANNAEFLGKATEEAWVNHQAVLERVEAVPVGFDPKRFYTYDYLPPAAELIACKW